MGKFEVSAISPALAPHTLIRPPEHIVNTLSIVQSKLAYLESEHNISRQRVQELELELKQCKKDVAQEFCSSRWKASNTNMQPP